MKSSYLLTRPSRSVTRTYFYPFYCACLTLEVGVLELPVPSPSTPTPSNTMAQQGFHLRTDSQDKVDILVAWCSANGIIIHPDIKIVWNQPPPV